MEGEPDEKGEIVLTVGSPFPHSGDLGLADAGAEDATLVAQGYAALTALRGPRAEEDPELLAQLDDGLGAALVGIAFSWTDRTGSDRAAATARGCSLGGDGPPRSVWRTLFRRDPTVHPLVESTEPPAGRARRGGGACPTRRSSPSSIGSFAEGRGRGLHRRPLGEVGAGASPIATRGRRGPSPGPWSASGSRCRRPGAQRPGREGRGPAHSGRVALRRGPVLGQGPCRGRSRHPRDRAPPGRTAEACSVRQLADLARRSSAAAPDLGARARAALVRFNAECRSVSVQLPPWPSPRPGPASRPGPRRCPLTARRLRRAPLRRLRRAGPTRRTPSAAATRRAPTSSSSTSPWPPWSTRRARRAPSPGELERDGLISTEDGAPPRL